MTDHQGGRDGQVLLDLKNVVTRFYTDDGTVHAVNGVSYTVNAGETLGRDPLKISEREMRHVRVRRVRADRVPERARATCTWKPTEQVSLD